MAKRNCPERTCVGCGGKAPKKTLLRFVVREDGTLQFDPRQVRLGRGGYFCPRSDCFSLAAKRRRIQVRCRRDVVVDPKAWMEAALRELNAEVFKNVGSPPGEGDPDDRSLANPREGQSPKHLESLLEMCLSLFPGGGSEWPR